MTESELDKVRRWISEGPVQGPERKKLSVDLEDDPLVSSDERQFWSFLPPKRPDVPRPNATSQVKTPADAFLLAKLDEKGLGSNAEAERVPLMRRAQAQRRSVVAPAQRSESAQRKAASKLTQDGLPVHSFRTLLQDLATLTRNQVSMNEQTFQMLASPTPVQERAFQLLQVRP